MATIIERLTAIYGPAADPVRAEPMRAYMRDQLPFLGIPSPRRRLLSREVLAGSPRPDESELRTVALEARLFDLKQRLIADARGRDGAG